ncbi:MAG: hypothetical protein U1G05_13785 [Kiritimatiellia bacterium]
MCVPLRILATILFLAGPSVRAGEPPRAVSDWGPFFYRGTNVHGHAVERAVGPFWERKTDTEDRTLAAVRPFYSKSLDPGAQPERWLKEYVWPLGSLRGHGNTRSGWFLTVIYMRDDVTKPDSRRRLWVLPFYFGGRTRDGKDYAAIFPIGGTIREFLTRDEIRFILFPFWSRSSINEVRTLSILWPFYSHTTGEGLYQRRVWPFWGVARKDGQYSKRFILWPFWNQAEYFFKGAKGKAWILFPIYGKADLEDQSTRWYIPPFFKVAEGNGNRRISGPWPFFQKSEGDIDKFYLFPLYGWKRIEDKVNERVVHRSFVLWPLGWRIGVTSPQVKQDSFQVLPFFYKNDRAFTDPADRGKDEHNRSFWPLFSSERVGDASRLRIPDLWPGKNPGGIERNWAPLWTFYQRETQGDARQTEFLWGMYRNVDDGRGYHHWNVFPLLESTRESAGGDGGWRFLKGLVGWSKKQGEKKLKLLYLFELPVGKSPP